MIPVRRAPEPPEFDSKVRQPGKRAIRELAGDPAAARRPGRKFAKVAERIRDIPSGKLPTYWRRALAELRAAYTDTCAYLGMRIHPATGAATIDHFRPKSKYQLLAYEWSNFRLATQQVNTYKGEHEDVIDPFDVGEGWLVLDIGTFEVRAAAGLTEPLRRRVERTIERLGLNQPTFCRARETYHDWYHGLIPGSEPGNSLRWLSEECPYVAFELQRQGRLREVDRRRDEGHRS